MMVDTTAGSYNCLHKAMCKYINTVGQINDNSIPVLPVDQKDPLGVKKIMYQCSPSGFCCQTISIHVHQSNCVKPNQ